MVGKLPTKFVILDVAFWLSKYYCCLINLFSESQTIDVLWLVNCWPSLSGRKETKAGSKFIIQQEIRRGRPLDDDDDDDGYSGHLTCKKIKENTEFSLRSPAAPYHTRFNSGGDLLQKVFVLLQFIQSQI